MMKYDIILAGVGGQGVLSLAALIAKAAMIEGLKVKQSEVHGMSQRGGSVTAHLRLSDTEIHSDLIGSGSADMLLSMEPLESLRYLSYLKKGGALITALEPVVNIPDYPAMDLLKKWIASVSGSKTVDAKEAAKAAGNVKASNVVMVGAACKNLPVSKDSLEKALSQLFSAKGEAVVKANIEALQKGAEA